MHSCLHDRLCHLKLYLQANPLHRTEKAIVTFFFGRYMMNAVVIQREELIPWFWTLERPQPLMRSKSCLITDQVYHLIILKFCALMKANNNKLFERLRRIFIQISSFLRPSSVSYPHSAEGNSEVDLYSMSNVSFIYKPFT